MNSVKDFVGNDELYASPPTYSIDPEQCHFYHVMDLPGFGVTGGQWDLRNKVDEYLGGVSLAGKRVLEIGPASGFLTAEMEKRGAEVVAIEVPDHPGWDFVPFPPSIMNPVYEGRRNGMRGLKDSFWFVHKVNGLKAKVHYGDVYNLPRELGSFDIATMAAVLLHTKSPHLVVAECAKFAKTIVITELLYQDMENYGPVMRLNPSAENVNWHTWWHFTTAFFKQFLGVLGFQVDSLTFHSQMATFDGPNRLADYFTIIASRVRY